MKKILLAFTIQLLLLNASFGIDETISTYSEKNKFGLIQNQTKITEAKYNKLIRLKDSSWLFLHKNKYGIISNDGEILVDGNYNKAERFVGRFAKLGSKGLFSLYDETGRCIIPHEYNSIELLYGKMFLVKKNYKYGLINFDGDIILAPIADDIYMPQKNVLKIQYEGTWYEIEQKNKETLELPMDIAEAKTKEGY